MNDPTTYFIKDPATGRIRFTRCGLENLGPRFAKAGFDIHRIRTLTEARAALDAVLCHEFHELAQRLKGEQAALDEALAGLPGW